MAKRPLIKKWTEEDIARLKQLTVDGATLMRAAAALRRSTSSVQTKAKQLDLKFRSIRAVRAELRAIGVLETRR